MNWQGVKEGITFTAGSKLYNNTLETVLSGVAKKNNQRVPYGCNMKAVLSC